MCASMDTSSVKSSMVLSNVTVEVEAGVPVISSASNTTKPASTQNVAVRAYADTYLHTIASLQNTC